MDTVNVIIVVLFVAAALMLAGSVTARRHSETRLALRRVEAKVDQVLQHAGLAPQDDLDEVHRALADGERILAIKAYRGATGADLATAKSEVSRIERGDLP